MSDRRDNRDMAEISLLKAHFNTTIIASQRCANRSSRSFCNKDS